MSALLSKLVPWLTVARDVLIVAGIAVILWLVYRGGEDRVRASDMKALQTQIQQQAKTLDKWRGESNDAQTKLSQEVAAINVAAATPIVHHWLPQPTCTKPAVLPAAASQARQPLPTAGGLQPVSGDILDGARRDSLVAAFKQRWETEFAECRALDAQWPQL